MAITTSGGLTPNPLVPGAYLLIGNATISGTGSTSVAIDAAGTLTITGTGTDIEFTNVNATAVATTINVAGGAHATFDALTGISALSSFNIGSGSTLTLGAGINASVLPTVDFGNSSGTLELAAGGLNLNVGEQINNFGPASSIIFDATTYDGGSYANGALTLTGPNGATTTVPLTNEAAFAGEYFHLGTSNGNTTLVLNNVAAGGIPACYCRGTLILTDHGEVAVEDLAIGDQLVTVSGQLRTLKWIGNRSYMARAVASNPMIRPVRILANALGECVPKRDLLISPSHAMLLGGVLVQAADLVNGTSILTESAATEVHYFHLELDTHDAIWAEGAASETYVEDDNRGIFHNGESYARLYPDDFAVEAIYCAPRVYHGCVLESVRNEIDIRSVVAGFREQTAVAA